MTGLRMIGVSGILLIASACATPISVTQVDPTSVHRELTRNVLTAGEPSDFSKIILGRAGLLDQFDSDPEAALWTLHTEVTAGRRGINQVFALAELSFLHAERTKQRSYYLASAIYAYAFLFPPTGTPAPEPYDPRYRNACDLYNRALTAALQSKDGAQVVPAVGVLPLPFGEIDIAFDRAQLVWLDRVLVDFVPVANLEVNGLRNRWCHAGPSRKNAGNRVLQQEGAGLSRAGTRG